MSLWTEVFFWLFCLLSNNILGLIFLRIHLDLILTIGISRFCWVIGFWQVIKTHRLFFTSLLYYAKLHLALRGWNPPLEFSVALLKSHSDESQRDLRKNVCLGTAMHLVVMSVQCAMSLRFKYSRGFRHNRPSYKKEDSHFSF